MRAKEWWIKQGSYGTSPEYEDFYSTVQEEPNAACIHVIEAAPVLHELDKLWAVARAAETCLKPGPTDWSTLRAALEALKNK